MVSAPFTTTREIWVPNFDPSFIGNTSFSDASEKSLAKLFGVFSKAATLGYRSVYQTVLIFLYSNEKY